MTNPNLMSAALIWDGAEPIIPDRLLPTGMEKEAALALIAEKQQMIGSPLERLCEIAGRSCYDSLGAEKSRPSAGYHVHINQVKHLSTVEHAAMTFNIHTRSPDDVPGFALMFLNRPNVWVRQVLPYDLRITLNLRHVLEWEQTALAVWAHKEELDMLGKAIRLLAQCRAAQICGIAPEVGEVRLKGFPFELPEVAIGDTDAVLQLCPPETDDEKWVSIFMTGSRGFSHEQVRHGDWTAISQRSTRFVDESTSAWVEHPLVTQYLASADNVERAPNGEKTGLSLRDHVGHVQTTAKHVYKIVVEKLQPWLEAKGVDKTTARKQARGAARGYLGNGLYTEVVFSASVAQWKRMIGQRLSPGADAEIREIYEHALPVLKACRYGDSFKGLETVPSPDGIGQVLKQEG